MMKITGLSHLFKWENLHNWWLTKYFFAPLCIYIYIYKRKMLCLYEYKCMHVKNIIYIYIYIYTVLSVNEYTSFEK